MDIRFPWSSTSIWSKYQPQRYCTSISLRPRTNSRIDISTFIVFSTISISFDKKFPMCLNRWFYKMECSAPFLPLQELHCVCPRINPAVQLKLYLHLEHFIAVLSHVRVNTTPFPLCVFIHSAGEAGWAGWGRSQGSHGKCVTKADHSSRDVDGKVSRLIVVLYASL